MKTEKIKEYSNVFGQLLKTELIIYSKSLSGNMVDNAIWIAVTTFVYAYILPLLGMQETFGTFYVVGAIVSIPLFASFPFFANFLNDIQGNKTIDYYLTLPIPSWMVLIKNAFGYMLNVSMLSLIVLPLGKLVLWNKISFDQASWLKLILIYFTTNIFMAFLNLFLVSYIPHTGRIGSAWSRVLFPMWFLGGMQFTWATLTKVSIGFSYFCLLNPMLYAFEGIRAAVLGQQGYISFWICVAVLWFSTILFGALGVKKMKKRLDFI